MATLASADLKGEEEEAPEPEEPALPSTAKVQSLIAELEQQPDEEGSDKAALLDAYRELLAELTVTAEWQDKRDASLELSKDASQTLSDLRAQLAEPDWTPSEDFQSLSLSEAEDLLLKARESRQKYEEELRTAAGEGERRITRRARINDRIAEIQRELNSSVDSTDPGGVPDSRDVGTVQTLLIRAARLAKKAELEALEAEVAAYPAAGELLSARRDVASKRVAAANQQIETLQDLVSKLSQQEARQALLDAQERTKSDNPVLAELANENAKLAMLRTGQDGITSRRREAQAEAAELEQRYNDYVRVFEETRERFEGEVIQQVAIRRLVSMARNRPSRDVFRARLESVETILSDVQQRLADLQDARDDFVDRYDRLLGEYTEKAVASSNEPEREMVAQEVRSLLESRRAIYQSLVDDYYSYFEGLSNSALYLQRILDQLEMESRFILDKLVSIRTGYLFERDLVETAVEFYHWTLSPQALSEAGRSILHEFSETFPRLAASIIAVLLLLIARRKALGRLTSLEEESRSGETAKPLFHAIALTIILALPGPAIMYLIGWYLKGFTTAPSQISDLATGLVVTSAHLFLPISLVFQACRSHGLAETQLDWPDDAVKGLRFHLRWSLPCLLVLYVVMSSALQEPDEQWRITFITVLAILAQLLTALFFWIVTPASGQEKTYYTSGGTGGARGTFAQLTRMVLTVGPFVLAVCAFVGYAYLSLILYRVLILSVVTIALVALAYALYCRWLDAYIERMANALARQQYALRLMGVGRQKATASQELTSSEEHQPDIQHIKAQCLKLGKFVACAIALIPLAILWSEMLPVLNTLDRVVLYPQWQFAPIGQDLAGSITVLNILISLAAIVLTVVFSRNIPAIVEIWALRSLQLDSAVRFAITTICRYVVILIGIVVAFNSIGIGWSKVQWLAAAITVGLGFGLQEIFANFVSGLIILFEQPIRIGDTVSVGNVTGKVTRIQMRATVITDWDRRELLVPNREFITGQLVNWSLSDTIARSTIDVGIAYGSDTELAQRVLMEIAQDNPTVLADPPPKSVFVGFGDNSLNFKLLVYLPNRDVYLDTMSALHMEIDKRFREKKIEIAFPQRDIHIRSVEAAFEFTRRQEKGDDGRPQERISEDAKQETEGEEEPQRK